MPSLPPINATSFFTDTLTAVDQMIGNFVQLTYHNLIQSNEVVITLMSTVYIIWMGYRLLTHTLSSDLMSLTRHLGLFLVVYGLLMNWQLYNLFFYNIFTNEPQSIAQVMVNAAGQGGSVQDVLNTVFNAVLMAAGGLFNEASWINPLPYVLGIIVLIGGSILCLLSLGLFIYAKIGMAIALALGPLFLALFLWDSTRNFFNSWVNKLMTFALFPVVTSVILAFMLNLINNAVYAIEVPGKSQGFKDISIFAALSLVASYFLMQVPNITAALGGGMTLGGLREATNSAKSVGGGIAAPIMGTASGIRGVTRGAVSMGRGAVGVARAVKRKFFTSK